MVDETLKEKCQWLYQDILATIEKNATLRPHSNNISGILMKSISNFQQMMEAWAESNRYDHPCNPEDANKQFTAFENNGNNNEIVEQPIVTFNGPDNWDASKCDEFDNGVRAAVSNIFNDTVKNLVENQQVTSDVHDDDNDEVGEELVVIDLENDENMTNHDFDATFNEPSQIVTTRTSEVVTQRTQHLMMAVDGDVFQMGITEEVVTTTTVMDKRPEPKMPDLVTPKKRKTQNNSSEEQPVKRRYSLGERTAATSSKPKSPPKRRPSFGAMRSRRASTGGAQPRNLGAFEQRPRRHSVANRGSQSGVDHSTQKLSKRKNDETMNSSAEPSKYEQAMKKRHSKLRRTVASRRDLELPSHVHDCDVAKNVDKNIHYSNTLYNSLCVLCDFKGKRLVTHYAIKHADQEIFLARPSPSEADELRLQRKRFNVIDGKISGYCFFCEATRCLMKQDWKKHLLIHTGESLYTCNGCHSDFKQKAHHKKCSSTPVSIFDFNATDGSLVGFICSDCNYMQISRSKIIQHLVNQHGHVEVTEGQEFEKVLLVPNPTPAQSTIASQYDFVAPAKRFKCTICSKKCNTADKFVKHFDEKHYDVKEYICFCDEKIAIEDIALNGSYVSAHLLRHAEHFYQCLVCGSVHFDKKDVDNHLLNDHMNDQFKCQYVLRGNDRPTEVTEFIVHKIKCNTCNAEMNESKFCVALDHFEKSENHRTNEVKVSGFMSKRVSTLAKKVHDCKTAYTHYNLFAGTLKM